MTFTDSSGYTSSTPVNAIDASCNLLKMFPDDTRVIHLNR